MVKLSEDSALDLEVTYTTLELISDMNLEDLDLYQCPHQFQLQDHGPHLFLYQPQEVGLLKHLCQRQEVGLLKHLCQLQVAGHPLPRPLDLGHHLLQLPDLGLLVYLELPILQQLHLTLYHLVMVQCLLLQAMELQLLQAIQLQLLLFLQAHFSHLDLFLLQHLPIQSLIMVDIMDILIMFNSQSMQDRIITIQFILMITVHILKEGQTLD